MRVLSVLCCVLGLAGCLSSKGSCFGRAQRNPETGLCECPPGTTGSDCMEDIEGEPDGGNDVEADAAPLDAAPVRVDGSVDAMTAGPDARDNSTDAATDTAVAQEAAASTDASAPQMDTGAMDGAPADTGLPDSSITDAEQRDAANNTDSGPASCGTQGPCGYGTSCSSGACVPDCGAVTCGTNASCVLRSSAAACECNSGYVNDGQTCVKRCGNSFLDVGEACDPTAPGWNVWTCNSRCEVQRAYTTCVADQGCGFGACRASTCTITCVSTSECLNVAAAPSPVRPYCGSQFTAFIDGSYRQICRMVGCTKNDDCPPHQLCFPEDTSTNTPSVCLPRGCVVRADCGGTLACRANVCVEE